MKKIIDRNGRLFGFISVIDLLVIVVVAVMGFALYTKNTQMAITSTNTADQTITYQILAQWDTDLCGRSSAGGATSSLTRTGAAAAPWAPSPTSSSCPAPSWPSLTTGTVAAATVEDGVDMLITVEGTGLVSESGRYTLNRVYELGVNSSRTFCTKYAEFIGTVTEIF